MSKNIFLLFVITVTANASGGLAPGLRVRFDMVGTMGENYFIKVPTTLVDAKAQGWKKTCRPRGPLQELDMYCSTDKVVCALIDDTGYIGGLQIAIRRDKFHSVFDWRKRGWTPWTIKSANGEITRFWTIQQYFVSEEYLHKSKAERIAKRDATRLLQEGAIWFEGTDNEVLKVSTNDDDIRHRSLFTEQACTHWMGQHYYYNMSSTTECTADQMYSWFVMTHNGELSATGLGTFGILTLDEGEKMWFETPGENVARNIIPHAPECLYAMPTLTMHIYYVDNPTEILCLGKKKITNPNISH